MQSWTSTGYFANSTGSPVTNCWFFPIIASRHCWLFRANAPSVQDWSLLCPSNTKRHFKIYFSSKNPSKRNPNWKWRRHLKSSIWSARHKNNKRKALSLHEVEVNGLFLISHIVLKTCTMYFMHKFDMSFVFHFYILGLMSWIWTNLSAEELKFESLPNEILMRASILTIECPPPSHLTLPNTQRLS